MTRDDLERGAEPDSSYYIQNESLVRDKENIDLAFDLPPDLVLEVEYSIFIPGTRHEFEVIRLWEQPTEVFLRTPGLLPFAVLSRTANPEGVLNQVAKAINEITEFRVQSNVAASTAILAGLLLEKEVIGRVLRAEVMRESVIYQEILQEGRVEGKAEGKAEALVQVARNLLNNYMPVEQVAMMTGLSVEQLQVLLLEAEDNPPQ